MINKNQPSTTDIIAYSAPLVGSYFFYAPMWAVLPSVYAKYYGLELTVVASIVLIVRLFDGITDPTVGYFSDRYRVRNGSRKSWVVVGGIASIISSYFLFVPQEPVTSVYFLLWSLVFFLALTLSEIPHCAWGTELTMDYNLRARIYSVRNMVATLGFLIFIALPLLPIYPASEYTPEVLRDCVYIGALLSLLGLFWMFFRAPEGVVIPDVQPKGGFAPVWQSIYKNKPLLIYFTGYFCFGISLGMWSGLEFIYLDSYLGIGGKLAAILTIATLAGLISTPLWLKFIHRTNKHVAWAMGLLCFSLQLMFTPLVEPGTSWWIPMCLAIIAYIGFAAHNVAAISVLADIIDYGELKFRAHRSATYIAFNNILYKWGLGVGTAIAFAITGFYGFDPSSNNHNDSEIFGLQLGYIYFPLGASFIGMLFILATPINRRRHKIIERRLKSRLQRSFVSSRNQDDIDSCSITSDLVVSGAK